MYYDIQILVSLVVHLQGLHSSDIDSLPLNMKLHYFFGVLLNDPIVVYNIEGG